MSKLQSHTVTGMVYRGMVQDHDDGDRARVTESHVYLPAEVIAAFNADRCSRIWTTRFGHNAGLPD